MGNTLNFGSAIYSSALNKPNSYKFVYNLANGYNNWSTIIDAWNQKSAEAYEGTYNTGDNKYEFAVEDTYWVVEQITSNALAGVNLTVNCYIEWRLQLLPPLLFHSLLLGVVLYKHAVSNR